MTRAIPLLLLLALASGCASMDDMSSDGKMMKDTSMQKDSMSKDMKSDGKM